MKWKRIRTFAFRQTVHALRGSNVRKNVPDDQIRDEVVRVSAYEYVSIMSNE